MHFVCHSGDIISVLLMFRIDQLVMEDITEEEEEVTQRGIILTCVLLSTMTKGIDLLTNAVNALLKMSYMRLFINLCLLSLATYMLIADSYYEPREDSTVVSSVACLSVSVDVLFQLAQSLLTALHNCTSLVSGAS